MLCVSSDLALCVSVLGEQSRLGIFSPILNSLGTEIQDEAQFWILSHWILGQPHTSLFCLFGVHYFRIFGGGFQSKFLKLWPDWRTSKRQDGLTNFQDAGFPVGLCGEGCSLLLSYFTVPHKLLGKCQVTTGGIPTLHISERSWDEGSHLTWVVSPRRAETRSQAS